MDPSRMPYIDRIVYYLNTLRVSLRYVQRIVGTEAMGMFIHPQWINSRYMRDPVIRRNIVAYQRTAQGIIFTSIDCSIIVSQLNDLIDTLLYFELPSFPNTS